MEPENLEVSLRYVLRYSTRAAISCSSSTNQKSRTTSWQAEDDGWRAKEETVHGWSDGKRPAVPQQDLQNAIAAATCAVSQRRRRPLGLDGRQAKAKYRLRKFGVGYSEIPR